MIQGLVPMITELNGTGLEVVSGGRGGVCCRVPPLNYRARAKVKNSIEGSLKVHGSRLFNCLPQKLKELASLERFKAGLDIFLARIPDRPCLPHYYQPACSNSIIDQLKYSRSS